MPKHTNEKPIRIPGEHWVEFHDIAVNLTGIPDDQFRSVDEDGNPLVETETMDVPLLEFHDTAVNLTGISDDEFAVADDLSEPDLDGPGANGTAAPSVPPKAPPKSV
jgi:hypothetical protein